MQNNGLKKISLNGASFLKAATAAPDFEALDLQGVPDGHSGPTVVVKQYITQTVSAIAGQSTYYICTPQCEVAYWRLTNPPLIGVDWVNGQDVQPVLFPKTGYIFGSVDTIPTPVTEEGGSNTDQISKVRILTNAAEMTTLNNAFNQYGSITCWKVPLTTQVVTASYQNPAPDTLICIGGIDGIRKTVVESQAYTCPVRDGAYSVSMNREHEFEFNNVRDCETLSSRHQAYFSTPGAAPGVRAKFNGPLATWDANFDTIVFRIDVPATVVDQSFLLKRWVTFEAQPVFNSLLWDTAHLSPERDEVALALYREMVRALPVAVPYKDNPDFWKRILEAIDDASNLLSFVPGPVGQVAKGVHAISSVLNPQRRGKRAPKGNGHKKK